MFASLVALAATGLPYGRSVITVNVKGKPIELYCYRPASYQGDRMIMVFHGTLRNADEYRDDSMALGRRFHAIIVAPKFDRDRFPSIKYQRGGILESENGKAAPESEWTYAYIPEIVKSIREREGNPDLKYWLLGHSAGGQFLVRMAAFSQQGAERIIAANPGSELFPTAEQAFGYGYGKLPEELRTEARMKAYLAQPLTLYLGTADNVPDEDLDVSPEAMAQGAARYQRGKAVYAFAQDLAKRKGWNFNWKLIEAPGIIHDHTLMFNAPQMSLILPPNP